MKTQINYEDAYKDLGELGIGAEEFSFGPDPDELEPVAPESQPEVEPAALPEPPEPVVESPAYATQESIKELENRFELYARQIQESVNRVQSPAPAQKPQEQALTQKQPLLETYIYDEDGNRQPDPLAEHIRTLESRLEAQDKAMQALHEGRKQAGEMQVNTQLGAALHEMRTRFPDFDANVRIEDIERGRQAALGAGEYNVDWRSALYTRYQQVVFPKLLQERDELAKKRDEKRDQATQAASVVPAGGSNYQKPIQPQLQTGKRGYADARAAMMSELDALAGG